MGGAGRVKLMVAVVLIAAIRRQAVRSVRVTCRVPDRPGVVGRGGGGLCVMVRAGGAAGAGDGWVMRLIVVVRRAGLGGPGQVSRFLSTWWLAIDPVGFGEGGRGGGGGWGPGGGPAMMPGAERRRG